MSRPGSTGEPNEPCIALVMPQHWERALLRAELIERGHDVVGMEGLGDLLMFRSVAAPAHHGPIGVVLVDREALSGESHRLIALASSGFRGVPFVLLVGPTVEVPEGRWTQIVTRPVGIGQIAETLEALMPSAVG